MKRPWTGPPITGVRLSSSATILLPYLFNLMVKKLERGQYNLFLALPTHWACVHRCYTVTERPKIQTWHDHVPSCVGLGKAQTLWTLLNQSHDYLPLSVFAGIKWDAVKVVHKIVSIRHMFIVGFSLAMLLSLQDISSPARDWTWTLGSEILESEPLDCKGIP